MNNRNYQRELDALITGFEKENKVPRLFLHSCCAPCSSYVLEYLSQYFKITVLYYNPNIYNPNISPKEEYEKRVEEIRRMIGEMNFIHPVKLVEGTYDPQIFFRMAKGLEQVPEGGERCFRCYRLRMEEAAKLAKEGGYDYFTTTLSISPLKNAPKIKSEKNWQRFTERPIFLLISRKKTATSVPLSCPENIICTVRITVAVYFQKETEMNKYAKNILFI